MNTDRFLIFQFFLYFSVLDWTVSGEVVYGRNLTDRKDPLDGDSDGETDPANTIQDGLPPSNRVTTEERSLAEVSDFRAQKVASHRRDRTRRLSATSSDEKRRRNRRRTKRCTVRVPERLRVTLSSEVRATRRRAWRLLLLTVTIPDSVLRWLSLRQCLRLRYNLRASDWNSNNTETCLLRLARPTPRCRRYLTSRSFLDRFLPHSTPPRDASAERRTTSELRRWTKKTRRPSFQQKQRRKRRPWCRQRQHHRSSYLPQRRSLERQRLWRRRTEEHRRWRDPRPTILTDTSVNLKRPQQRRCRFERRRNTRDVDTPIRDIRPPNCRTSARKMSQKFLPKNC